MRKLIGLAALTVFSIIGPVQGQLAITEVMSSASTNLGPASVTQNSDYWELTNFGTNRIDLTGYKFDDSDNNLAAADSTPFTGLIIGPGQSVVFVQNSVNTNDVSFREWWGTNVTTSSRIVFYSGNGLSSGGDGLRLWGPNAQSASDVVDSVDFAEAVRGAAFTYDPQTGDFGVVSTNGVNGAFKAATADDVGSPGRSTGPTPLAILQQPQDVVANPGDIARFTLQVRGRPRGTIQWYFENGPIPGATNAVLQIAEAQASSAGAYFAVVNNGVTEVKTATAQLVLASEAAAPAFTLSPESLSMYAGQSYTFQAAATGVPRPGLQWQINGRDLDGATGATFSLANASEQDSGLYSVIAKNAVGSVTNSFPVTVTAKPQLAITEVMSSSSTNATGHQDWWELTNLGSFAVKLTELRFDDNSEMLSAAFTFTNDFQITPNESIIFVESMTPDEFRQWWGAEFLLPNLQILTYRGNGLSSAGDAVNLWNAAASEDSDKLASAVFSTATAGLSFGYNPETGQFGDLSASGVNGAFAADDGGDVGSPGYIRNEQRVTLPRFRSIEMAGGALRVVLSTQPGLKYAVESKSALGESGWTPEKEVVAADTSTSIDLPFSAVSSQRFLRVRTAP